MRKKVAIWGYGEYLKWAFPRLNPDLDIQCICDSNSEKWETDRFGLGYKCVAPQTILGKQDIFVLIAVQNKKNGMEIAQILAAHKMNYTHINNAIKEFQPQWEKEKIEAYDKEMEDILEPGEMDILKRFISISVPVEKCNLRCEYCYIGQTKNFHPTEVIYPSPQFIRRALSRKRLGGTALLNFCGVGETLLSKELIPILIELLAEGHYISIITNAIVTEPIKKLINISGEYNQRLFFKCSFHYRQLVQEGLLEKFVANINMIKKSKASYSIEMVPEDELVPFIDEIKSFSMKNFGALPHLTVARDETVSEWPILTKFSKEEYIRIWGQFHSAMFDFKMYNRKKQTGFCWAGERALLFSLENGNLMACPGNLMEGNIYDAIDKDIPYKPVGKNCANSHCINAHAYLTLGLIAEVGGNSYLETRNRVTATGEHWIQPKMAAFMEQRLCDNYPLITVAVAVYNIAPYIEECLNSITKQSYKNLEIIVIDDGSDDGSGEICDRIAQGDRRIKVYHTENRGLVAARKAALEKATGKYLAFVDGDDYIDENMYEELLKQLVKDDSDFIHSVYIEEAQRHHIIQGNIALSKVVLKNEEDKKEFIQEYVLGNAKKEFVTASVWSKLFKTDFIKKCYTAIPDEQQYGEDYLCLLRSILEAKQISFINKAYYHYRIRNDSMSHGDPQKSFLNEIHLGHYVLKLTLEYRYIEEIMGEVLRRRMRYWVEKSALSEVSIPQFYWGDMPKLFGKKIILYGAGRVGQDYYAQICKYQQCEIVAWVDINAEKISCDYATIYGLQWIYKTKFDYLLIAIEDEKVARKICCQLEGDGLNCENIIWDKPQRYF